MKKKTVYIIVFILLNSSLSFAFQKDTTKTILQRNDKIKNPIQKLTGTEAGNPAPEELPSGPENFSPQQDSAYKAALSKRIPLSTRARQDILLSETFWEYSKEMGIGTPWQIAMRDILRLNPNLFAPSAVDLATHQYHLEQSMYVPGVQTLPKGGLKIPLHDIGVFLGVKEDLSPNIKYRIDYLSEIEIVIYSVKATVIATIFEGVQKPGSYSITWNLRDDNGKLMPSGDYIAEVRIGNERFIRKRIEIK